MHETALVYAYLVLVGLVAGGIAVSAFRLATNRPASFQARPDTMPGALGQVAVIVFGGPLVLMRNAIRGHLLERRPPGFLAASAVIASLWCFLSGAFLVHLLERAHGL